ncbi:hypothetical protein BLNAU_17358 [Blattamonas nauphoetae]|uniref:GOLD domain-containing protein n=1 Tax=Blattamonas nauphoetae TaxID=2049346 RepID=A0ABQ9X8W9_9EUKA|nr:hypothetical protein BLNAU_17358 [Blattamonas nauphoetae]
MTSPLEIVPKKREIIGKDDLRLMFEPPTEETLRLGCGCALKWSVREYEPEWVDQSTPDGMVHCRDGNTSSTEPCHAPLKTGDQVMLKVEKEGDKLEFWFFVNQKAGPYEFSFSCPEMKIGFSLAGPGTSIRLDAIAEVDEALREAIKKQMNISETEQILSTPQPPPPREDSIHATSAKAETPSQDDVDSNIEQTLTQKQADPTKTDSIHQKVTTATSSKSKEPPKPPASRPS